MTKDEIWTVIDATSCSPKEKKRLKIAVDYYSRALLQQAGVSGSLEFGKPQMNIAALRDKMKEFFDTITPDELIREFELLGYEFKPIDGQANDH